MDKFRDDYKKVLTQYPHFIKRYNDILSENEKLKKEYENLKDKSIIYENKKAEDFYDVIIKINSIQNLDKGWEILMNEIGKNNYNQYKEEPIVRIGVIGNENKGKSTILRRLSDFNIPIGYSIKTEGLSIKYPYLKDNPNLKIVLLDSVGLEAPLLDFENENNNNKNSEEHFIDKARDKLLTEVFLQNFIIKNTDLLLLVFGKLSFEEQKLLEKVKRDMKNLKRKESLYVIHNLKEFERKVQVENYINETLFKSSTFKINKSPQINKDNKEELWNYFYEPNSNPKIFHLIFAREGTEAGNFYNNKTINYILNKSNDITDKEPFDIFKSIKENFCSISESILEGPLKIEKEDLIVEENIIKFNNSEKQIKLKRCLIDDIGFSNFLSNGYEPKYEHYISEDKLIINVEIPGEVEDGKIIKKTEGSYTFIYITGNKVNNKEDSLKKNVNKENSYNKREFGRFSIKIKLDKVSIRGKPDIKKGNGIITYIYQLETEDEDNATF